MAEMDAAAPAQPAGANGKNGNGNGKKKYVFFILIILAVAGLAFGAKWLAHRLAYTETEDAQVDADIVPVSSKVPGRIINIAVSEGDVVEKGQLLAEIDPTDYRIAQERAAAGLEAAENELARAESGLALARAGGELGVQTSETSLGQVSSGLDISTTQQELSLTKLTKDVERAELNAERARQRVDEVQTLTEQAKTDLARAQKLYESGVVSKASLDLARTNAETMDRRLGQVLQEIADAEKQLDLARSNRRMASIDKDKVTIAAADRRKAGLAVKLSRTQLSENVRSAEKAVKALRAKVRDARAQLEQADTALSETRVLAPSDGIVAKKSSQPMEIVAAGKPIVFVRSTARTWVLANIEETKLHNLRVGSQATVTVDALPGKEFRGKVGVIGAAANSKFSLIPSSNTSGQFIKVTQRVPVKIYLDGDHSELRPGTNVIVSIKNEK